MSVRSSTAKPAGMPVSRATKLEMAINLGTAKRLGLKLPDALLAPADEVIEAGWPAPGDKA